jgi:hypothetical protein
MVLWWWNNGEEMKKNKSKWTPERRGQLGKREEMKPRA